MKIDIKQSDQLIRENTIVKHYAGSHAYGTAIATSDVDFRGVFVADPVNIRTPFFPVREVDDMSEEDTKLYELNQFMRLALDCNPNVVETLWVDQGSIVVDTPAYQLLREYRQHFLSSKIAFTTSGYAVSQLKRIKGHNKWISNPQPEERPRAIDFVSMVQHFPKDNRAPIMPRDFKINAFGEGWRLIPYGKDIFGAYHTGTSHRLFNPQTGSLNDDYEGDDRSAFGLPSFIVKFNRAEYTEAVTKWQQYWDWKHNRNHVRSELEEQFGYDTKHALHLVRLLRMGVEALTTGVIHVKRPDAEELLAIRNGSWTYEQLIEYADYMDDLVRNTLYRTTQLRKAPDIKLAAQVLIQVQDMCWNK